MVICTRVLCRNRPGQYILTYGQIVPFPSLLLFVSLRLKLFEQPYTQTHKVIQSGNMRPARRKTACLTYKVMKLCKTYYIYSKMPWITFDEVEPILLKHLSGKLFSNSVIDFSGSSGNNKERISITTNHELFFFPKIFWSNFLSQ